MVVWFVMTGTPFEHVLMEEMIPFVDANFRPLAGRRHRAMAGLSMGGALTHGITLAQNAGVNAVYDESPLTAHEWLGWRRDLHEFAPLLFQK